MALLRRLFAKTDTFSRGQTLAEYVLIVSAIAVICFAGYQSTGTTVAAVMSSVDSQM